MTTCSLISFLIGLWINLLIYCVSCGGKYIGISMTFVSIIYLAGSVAGLVGINMKSKTLLYLHMPFEGHNILSFFVLIAGMKCVKITYWIRLAIIAVKVLNFAQIFIYTKSLKDPKSEYEIGRDKTTDEELVSKVNGKKY